MNALRRHGLRQPLIENPLEEVNPVEEQEHTHPAERDERGSRQVQRRASQAHRARGEVPGGAQRWQHAVCQQKGTDESEGGPG